MEITRKRDKEESTNEGDYGCKKRPRLKREMQEESRKRESERRRKR